MILPPVQNWVNLKTFKSHKKARVFHAKLPFCGWMTMDSIAWQSNSCWKRPLEATRCSLLLKAGPGSRLLRAAWSWVLFVSKHGNSTDSLLFHILSEYIFFSSHLVGISLILSCICCLSSYPGACLRKVWLHLLCTLPISSYGQQWGVPLPFSS